MRARRVCCGWCDQFQRPVTDRPPWNRPLFAAGGFQVVPSLGALVPGWLLVAPIQHRLRVADCSPGERRVLAAVRHRVSVELEAMFGPVIAFEHGPHASASPVGCTVDHAHLHMVPFDGPVSHVARDLVPEISWESVRTMDAAWDSVDAEDAYVVIEEKGDCWLARDRADRIPSQLFRQAIADLTGDSDWNWRTEPRVDNVDLTIREFASARW